MRSGGGAGLVVAVGLGAKGACVCCTLSSQKRSLSTVFVLEGRNGGKVKDGDFW